MSPLSLPARFILLLFACSTVVGDGGDGGDPDQEEDWTAGCPRSVCRCKWVSGKRTAECQDAGLQFLPDFGRPDRIQVLHMEGNPLRALPERIFKRKGLINLQKAYLRNCSLAEVDATAFEGLVILIELDLSHNILRTLQPGTFAGNIRIRKLWLSRNPIRSLSGFSFPHIPHLRILDLSHCLLNKLSRPNFMLLEYLEVLHLNDNHFKRLDKRVFVPLRQLKSLTMENNPWQCDCRLQDFWRWLMANNLFSLPTACAMPEKLEGITWDKLNEASLACPPVVSASETMVSVSSGVDVVLACLITAHPGTEISWVRSGMVIANNSRSTDDGGQHLYTIKMGSPVSHHFRTRGSGGKQGKKRKVVISSIDGSAPKAHNDRKLEAAGDGRRKWFNLTIDNVHPSGSGSYTCVAKNEGGLAEANITVVYSDSVTTYLDDNDLSALVVAGAAAGGIVFVLMSVCLVFIAARRRLSRDTSNHHRAVAKSGVEQHQLVHLGSSSGFSSVDSNRESKNCSLTTGVGTSVAMGNGIAQQSRTAVGGGVVEDGTMVADSLYNEGEKGARRGKMDTNFCLQAGPSNNTSTPSSAGQCVVQSSEFSSQKAVVDGGGGGERMQEMASQYQVQQQSDHLKETSDFEMARLHSKATAGYCATATTTALVENDAAQNRSFDSVRTDSGCGSSINAYNNSSNSSSGSSSNGSNGLLLPPTSTSSSQASTDVTPHSRRCPNNILLDNTSPSGCTSSSSSASIFGGHASTSAPDNASSSTLAETSSSASTVKSSTFDLPPSHSVMDRMWRKEVGSNSHLLAPSVENSRESLFPYPNGMWTSPMHCKQYNGQGEEEEGMLLVRHNYEDISGDFTLPRNSALVSHHRHPKGGVLSDSPVFSSPHPSADTSDHRHLLAHHYHLQHQASLPSSSASASSSPLRQHGFSPTDHLRAGMRKNKPPPFLPSAPLSSSTNPRPNQKNPSPLLISDGARGSTARQQLQHHSPLLNGQPQPQASKVPPQHHPKRSSLFESAAAATTATVNLLAQELETRKELLEALVKDKNDTIV